MRAWLFLLAVCAAGQVSTFTSQQAPPTPSSPGYLLTSFAVTRPATSVCATNSVMTSIDAVNWNNTTPLSLAEISALGGTLGNRDPSIMKSPLDGTYWIAATACNTGNLYDLQYVNCTITQTANGGPYFSSCGSLQAVSVRTLGLGSAVNTWAPEWFIDPNTSGLTSIHLTVSVSSTGSTAFKLYETHPTLSDFSTWSNLVEITPTGASDVIDPFMVWRADLSKYMLWYKCDTNDSVRFINYATSSTLTGTYTDVKTCTDWLGTGFLDEGPAILCLANCSSGTPTLRLYVDDYHGSLTEGLMWYCDSTDGWATGCPTAFLPINAPQQSKQGTVIPYP